MFNRDGKKKEGEVVGYIGKGVEINGRLSFESTVRIDGTVKGEIETSGTLIIGDSGCVEGTIRVGTTIITGEVRGIVEASKRVELKSPCKLYGDIKTPSLMIGEGAIFEGNCTMTGSSGRETFQYGLKSEETGKGLLQ